MPINFNGSYSENFDTLATAGATNPWTNDSTILGWSLFRQPVPGTAITTYGASTGSDNAGNFYSYGATSSSDRALGGLASGGTYFGSPASGAVAGWIAFSATNSTGSTITSLNLSFDGEQWRNGGNTTAQTMTFQYGIGSSFTTVSNWTTPGTTFNWTSPVATATAAAVDGNVAGRVANVGGTLSNLSWASGDTLWFRWIENNDVGNDHGLAIDNFSLSADVPPPPLLPEVTIAASPNSTTEGSATAGLFTITRTGDTTNPLTVTFTTGGTATSGSDYTTPTSFATNSIEIPAGQSSVSIAITSLEDTLVEPVETVTVTLSTSANYTIGTGNTATVSINDNDVPVTKIHQIQGSGNTFNTAFGGTQTIEGIVVAAFPGSAGLSGFYVQEEDADADGDSTTSEGIFVFDPTGLFSGAVGDKVRVTGLVAEFTSSTSTGTITGTTLSSSLTQISLANTVTNRSVTNLGASVLPAITNVTIPVTDVSALERYEGMRVNVSAATGPLTVTNNFTLARFGQVGLSANGRLDQYTQVNTPDVARYTEYFNNLLDNYIILDDGSNTQNPATVIHARNGQPLSATNTLRGGDTIASITGVLDQRFEGYRVQTNTPANFQGTNPRENVAPNVGGTLKVASFNLLNFFNGDGLGSGFPTSRGADTLTEYNRQLPKTVQAILGLNPDVFGYNEMENDGYGPTSAVQTLVDALNAATAPGTYAFVTPPASALNAAGGFGGDEITVGFIYKTSAVRIAPGTSVAALTTGIFAQDDANRVQRPPLAVTFERLANGTPTNETFTAIINHFKSKGSAANLPGDADQGDGQGLSNATRTLASQQLAAWLATNPTGTTDPDYLIMGDLNAYRFEDPITTLTNAGYTSLFGPESYSYQFRGQWGSLDHALASSGLTGQVTGAAKWHINADEPLALDYNTEFKSAAQQTSFYNADPFASSDHDPLVVGLNLTATNAAPTAIALTNTVTTLLENTSTATRIKVADISITDDGFGTNGLSLSGADAGFFEVDGNILYLRAGTTLDFETKSSYAITVNVDDTTVGSTPDASANYTLTLQDRAVEGVDLSTYVRIGRYTLPEPTRTTAPANSLLAQEVSAVTYNWDTDTLFVIGDGGRSIVQVNKRGQLIDSMTLASGSSPQGTEFYDTEGLTYIGNGQFVLAEERDRQVSLFTYNPAVTLSRSLVQTVDLGTNIGNIGLEGLSYDPLTNGFIVVKENNPQGIFQTGINFVAGTATNGSSTTTNSTNLFDPSLANLVDLSDVFALSNLPSLEGTSNYSHLLIVSQESGKVINLDRSGNLSSSLTIVSDSGNPLSVIDQGFEGVTMDRDGLLYLTSEEGGGDVNHPQLWVYAPSTFIYTNQAPVGVSIANPTTSLAENTSTASRIKIGNIIISDDALGTNALSLAGTDASTFEISGTELFLKAGVNLNFELKASYSVTVNVDDPTVGNTPDATTNFTLAVTNVNEVLPSVIISEVSPWSSGNTSYAADWFEVTNTGTTDLNLSGWRMDDNSNAFANSVALRGVTLLPAGKSAIFLESNASGSNDATIIANFLTAWFGSPTLPSELLVGTYGGSGVGLSTDGDAVNLFDATGDRLAGISFGPSTTGVTFDNTAGLGSTTLPLPLISTLSVVGTNGAFSTQQGVGSPGNLNRVPAVALSNPVNTIAENTSTTTRIRVADIAVTDDGLGTNVLSLTGADAASFEIEGNQLFLKANTDLNFEGKPSYAVTVNVDDATVGNTPDASVNFTLNLTNVNEAPEAVNDTVAATDVQPVIIAVLANDTDVDAGDALSIQSFTALSNPASGTLILNANNTFTFNPTGGFVGSTAFSYTAQDTAGLTSTATVTINVTEGINQIFGTNGDDNLVGTSRKDIIQGLVGNDILNGAGGSDTLIGGLGDDTYIVDALDTIVENEGEGTDLVQSSITFSLAPFAHVENLTLTGSANINGTGNDLNNVLRGNSGLNILSGGLGDDIYVVGSGDVIIENAGEGTDLVQSSVTFSLATFNNVENLTLTGSAPINGTGNVLDNVITGNSANNTLNGGDGNDTLNGGGGDDTLNGGEGNDILNGGIGGDRMVGGTGDDTYYVNIADDDRVVEAPNEGTDTVFSSVTYTLGSNVENLTLTGSAALEGNGNGLNNVITGNTGNNILTGGGGNDTLIGGTGSDRLSGGTGSDFFVYNAFTDRGDTITDFNTSLDKLDLRALNLGSNPVTTGFLRFKQSGSSTLVQIDPNGAVGGASFSTLATLNNVTAANLIVGTNVLI